MNGDWKPVVLDVYVDAHRCPVRVSDCLNAPVRLTKTQHLTEVSFSRGNVDKDRKCNLLEKRLQPRSLLWFLNGKLVSVALVDSAVLQSGLF